MLAVNLHPFPRNRIPQILCSQITMLLDSNFKSRSGNTDFISGKKRDSNCRGVFLASKQSTGPSSRRVYFQNGQPGQTVFPLGGERACLCEEME